MLAQMGIASRAKGSQRLLATTAPGAVLWIRVAISVVFVSEGAQKFLFPAGLGAGRFAKIGIPMPALMGPFIGGVELVAGLLVLVGLLTRLGALLLLADMTVAILSTKIPILLGHGYWRFAAPPGDKTGIWQMLHEARTDMAMWLACLFLCLVGAGWRSVDARLAGRRG
jgi:putative oxidoreductase